MHPLPDEFPFFSFFYLNLLAGMRGSRQNSATNSVAGIFKVIDGMKFQTVTVVLTMISGSQVLAHPGHGDPTNSHGLTHYLAHPSHFLPVLLLAAGAVLVLNRLRAAR